MLLLRWHALLSLWLYSHAVTETTVLYSESGNSITLRCSSAECPSSIEGFSGMYLNKKFMESEEVLYLSFQPGRLNLVTVTRLFKKRTQVYGSLQEQNITISNLTVHDSGFYSCVFANFPEEKVRCNTYLLVVKGVPCDVDPTTPPPEPVLEVPCPSLVLPITITCAVTTLVILTCLLLRRLVQKWMRERRRVRNTPESNDYVYEVMTKDGLCPLPSH